MTDRARTDPDNRDRDHPDSVTRVLPLLLGVVVLAGCGGDDADPAEVLSQTAANLGKIQSAESMHLKLLVDPGEDDPFGFEVEGPVALCDLRPLPILDVEYTQIANGQEATVRIVANGERGFVVLGDTAYQMTRGAGGRPSLGVRRLRERRRRAREPRVGDGCAIRRPRKATTSTPSRPSSTWSRS